MKIWLPVSLCKLSYLYQYACLPQVGFEAGELVLVPRSKGGLCYGVLETSKMQGSKEIWNVAVGPKLVKPVPALWIGKLIAQGASLGGLDTLGEPQRAVRMNCL